MTVEALRHDHESEPTFDSILGQIILRFNEAAAAHWRNLDYEHLDFSQFAELLGISDSNGELRPVAFRMAPSFSQAVRGESEVIRLAVPARWVDKPLGAGWEVDKTKRVFVVVAGEGDAKRVEQVTLDNFAETLGSAAPNPPVEHLSDKLFLYSIIPTIKGEEAPSPSPRSQG